MASKRLFFFFKVHLAGSWGRKSSDLVGFWGGLGVLVASLVVGASTGYRCAGWNVLQSNGPTEANDAVEHSPHLPETFLVPSTRCVTCIFCLGLPDSEVATLRFYT